MRFRFYLDEDVDARVARYLRKCGHQVWTTSEAGSRGAGDDDQVHYATRRGAVLVTNDRGLAERQRRHGAGQIVEVANQRHALEMLERYLPDVLDILARHRYVVVTVRLDGAGFTIPSWGDPTGTWKPPR